MIDGEKVGVPESAALVSWTLFFTAVVAGMCLGQHFVKYGTEEADNVYQTLIGQLRRELKQERSKVSELRAEVKLEKDAKDDALKRLSAIMSSRLRDGNPNVVDLSDQNRPMKVGEQFSELYDNQWTDAYSDVENYFKENEPKIIDFLLSILEQCFKACQQKAEKQLERLRTALMSLEVVITKKPTKLQNDLMQRIKEERKLSYYDGIPEYAEILPRLKKSFSPHVGKSGLLEKSALKAFIQECLRLSWLMVIQDPPMTMILKPDAKATDNFKAYKQRGNSVDFVVWPALLLREGGQLITKGVAEFRK